MTIKDFFVKLTTGELSSECNISVIDPESIERIELSNSPTMGWSTQSYADTQGKNFIVSLNEAIWYIDKHGHQKFVELLAPYTTSSWMPKNYFNWLYNAFYDFVVAILNYIKFLQYQHNITAINYASEMPVQSVKQATTIHVHKQNFLVAAVDKSKYYHLEQALTKSPLWKPIDIEEFLPIDPVFNSGNNAFNAILIWKIDEQADEEKTLRENNKVIKNPGLTNKLIESLQAPIHLISNIFNYNTVTYEDRTAADIKKKFFDHGCIARHYFFLIKKCSKLSCNICRPPHCSLEDFEQLHCFPDPVPGDNLYYKSFEELYSMQMTENHRLSLINLNKKTKPKHTMPFCPAAACAKNIGITVNCIECDKPHLLFSAKKLSEKDHTLLQRFLDTIFYTCGMSFHGTCDLSMTIPPKLPDLYNELESNSNSDKKVNKQENNGDDSDKEVSNNYAKESISEHFQEFLLIIYCPVLQKSRSYIIQLKSIQMFVLIVDAWRFLD
ncbi:4725_t:CDS:2 [Gigaspora margarita]|uniref:4725_t:CDS:1 n=1 Tax=Gigaspora margarita TaxID=4874 RepID=A0ABN7V3V5_GIGMA|nr:4725_t:CDS:2 [Gigaspora margarita]